MLALTSTPTVYTRDGTAYASSRDVAAFFGKRHADVLRAIDNLIADLPEEAVRNFAQGSYRLPNTGPQDHRLYEMDRKGFVFVTMGFTGKKAMSFKSRYIDEFDRMEAALKAPQAPALPDFIGESGISMSELRT